MAPEPVGPVTTRKPNRRKPPARANRTRPHRPTSGDGTGRFPGQVGSEPKSMPELGLTDGSDLWWLDGAARYSQAYGNDNSNYQYGEHDGVDIAVTAGSGVAAVTSGEVIFAGDAGDDGYRVGIRQPNG